MYASGRQDLDSARREQSSAETGEHNNLLEFAQGSWPSEADEHTFMGPPIYAARSRVLPGTLDQAHHTVRSTA